MKNYPPIEQVQGKKEEVQAMFDAIAPRYDLLNRILSFGIDRRWRRQAVAMLREHQPRRILDVATGTADLAIEALSLDPEKVVGVDISDEMLRIGQEKIERLGLADRITLRKGDAERLPFSDSQFDAVLVAFGVRNFENLEQGLRQIARVLRPGGVLVVLEFSRPRRFPVKQLYRFYARHILPRVGRSLSRNEGAYQYLPDSIAAFPDGPHFLDIMEKAGFKDLRWKPLTFGIASLYKGTT
ncbi:bifunctional demethylmenaquinone methyltransferase/2-methoxy-6-polyprenyl-1,4-benzoquinol methylase UbiE [Rhodocaloribacter litoris]|uniref:bifunctional demethylmenaquinone methyltransferase/2-methoxy-6-polyprenyl-1,4-benzoquinol methylase UbiE n=1 Tax=Rhodocaloribacter litoris TaxID=2558931 RepID=UPI0014218084|nr:bifunctional demethylmenaquinone methyltransferase/2-methoxy-6-polyprenyl-1,4-benzoquinol methylase UbiE [Rhodocaloribacter litoris]QXD16691.1 bifunctional demethylmenaquinone methyltransferase/2-methoxy-6-polyprenyl-1,4-benzoquinol methylase UbiE [Rhodocaloribacter litoris]GIV59311.1 MAG: demethylmenaquinone methyltransferase [Rhodothermaceae bacterium]